jgi:hypothetical protein
MGIPLNPAQEVSSLKTDMGGSVEQSYVTVPSDVGTGSLESFTATLPAGDGAAQGDYLAFTVPGGHKFAVWLNLDSDDTPPSGAVYTAADSKVEVDVTVTGTPDTAAEVAAAVKAAIELDGDFDDMTIVDNEDGSLTFTAGLLGNLTNAAPHNTGDTGAGSIEVSIDQAGAAASAQNTYISLTDDDEDLFHVWLNVNSEGSDPAPSDSTGIEVAIAAQASANEVAAAIATAIDDNAEFAATADNSRVRIVTATKAVVADISAGNSGFTVAVSTQGAPEKYSSAESPSDISNSPSPFVIASAVLVFVSTILLTEAGDALRTEDGAANITLES